jgi:hypothetical protein
MFENILSAAACTTVLSNDMMYDECEVVVEPSTYEKL